VDLVIRQAGLDDVEAISEISRRGWIVDYAGLLPAGFLAGRAAASLTAEWREYLSAVPDRHRLLVAEQAGRVLGFIPFGPGEHERSEDGEAEIYGFYVVPERIGEGIGRACFAAALHRLREEGYRGVMLWTFTGNARAERFYARAGFRLDGAVRAKKETGVEERRWRAEL
jgi:ribosomal protein S18 acetylase RimI-like enzyme